MRFFGVSLMPLVRLIIVRVLSNSLVRLVPLLVFLNYQAFPAETDKQISKKEWRLSFARLMSDSSSDASLVSASNLVPRLVYDNVSDIKEHLISGIEARSFAKEQIEIFKREDLKALDKLYAEQDVLFFTPNSSRSSRVAVEKKIREAKKKIELSRAYSVDNISVPAKMALKIITPSADALIFQSEGKNADALMRRHSLDMLIGGDITRVGDYFAFTIVSYGNLGRRILWEGGASQNDFESIAAKVADVLRAEILGRDWAGIDLKVIPLEAFIKLDDKVVGIGEWSDSTLAPGVVELDIQADGYKPERIELKLINNRSMSYSLKLEASPNPMVMVRTNPTGADLRISGVWQGISPLALELPESPRIISVEKEGYKSQRFTLNAQSGSVNIELEKLLMDPEERHKESRRKLNNSITFFSMSLAPTFIMLGVNNNFRAMAATATNAGNFAERDAALVNENIGRGVLAGSVALSVGLFTYLMFKLFDFFDATEGLSD